jgi:ferredoxin
MKKFRYLPDVSTLRLDEETCIGCGMCETVCPHRVFELQGKKAHIHDFDGCIECGACATNCPVSAIALTPGVGCAAYIIHKWLKNRGINLGDGCC